MHRLRTTFTRSRTPTGADMKTQSSLDVPKHVRSASFDEIKLEAQRTVQQLMKHHSTTDENTATSMLLQVPAPTSQRSRSFDSAGSDDSGGAAAAAAAAFLDIPRRFQRRRSSGKGAVFCIHCQYVEEYRRQMSSEDGTEGSSSQNYGSTDSRSSSFNDFSSEEESDEEGDEEDDGQNDGGDNDCSELFFHPTGNKLLAPAAIASPCGITFTLSPTNGDFLDFPTPGTPPMTSSPVFAPSSPAIEVSMFPFSASGSSAGGSGEAADDDNSSSTSPYPAAACRQRRRSISRQEAIFVEPTGNSLENVSKVEETDAAGDETAPSEHSKNKTEPDDSVVATETSSNHHHHHHRNSNNHHHHDQNNHQNHHLENDFVSDIYLAVPDLKRDRAASVDSCFSKMSSGAKTEELQLSDGGLTLTVPSGAVRSRSVDIVLPTEQQARYKALALAGPIGDRNNGKGKPASGDRQIRSFPDWDDNAISGEHLWLATTASIDVCHAGDNCSKRGDRMRCSACKILAHSSCINAIMDRQDLACKPTFRDVGIRAYREQTKTHHHWVHRRTEKGKCKACSKSLQAKLSFSSKDIVALTCAWCKDSYHNKESCFDPKRIGEECSLGEHSKIIVPPAWIVKLPRKGSFKSSLRKTPKKKQGSTRKSTKEKEHKTFVIKPIPTSPIAPVLVFINPKSGGNQGVKLVQKFQWLLNPRQVFDLTKGGPNFGLELFRKVPQLKVLACGGDGTVGWVLSVLDKIGIIPPPAVGTLPLGTGNDLARALGWGGGYTDEPIGKILQDTFEADTILLDRWSLNVQPNPAFPDAQKGKDTLPLNVVNNYYSLGVDAHIALEFHEAREAHPERFNSRIRNKMYYGQMGGKDLLIRKWKNLSDYVTLECDGEDLTPKLKDLKVHCIVFLNIPSYGGGTHPWNKSAGKSEPSTEDGLIEVVGLTTYQLPFLQAGGHGTCITQCKSAKLVTSKTIPMQVDGEACKLKPSIIELSLLNKAVMLAKKKKGRVNVQQASLGPYRIMVHKIRMRDYENHQYDKDQLKERSTNIGDIEVDPSHDLEQVRKQITKMIEENASRISAEWCFVDSCTAERFFRIDRAQENLHYVSDIANDLIFVLDQGGSGADQDDMPTRSRNMSMPNDSGLNDQYFDQARDHANNLEREKKKNATQPPPPPPPRVDIVHFKTFHERLFGLEEDNFGFSSLLERNTDDVIKASKNGDFVMLKTLHVNGYSLQAIDSSGQTALHYAAKFGHKEIVKYLVTYAPNAIVNMTENIQGQTALHLAAENKRRTICFMLVAAGADLHKKDNNGNTPRMLAFKADDHQLAAYLESQEQFLLDPGTNNAN